MPLDIKPLLADNPLAFDDFYAIYQGAFPPCEQKSKDAILAIIESSSYTIFTAFADKKMVGFSIMYHPQNDDFFLLEYIATSPTQHSKGLGSSLLKQSMQILFDTYGKRPLLIEIESLKYTANEHERTIRHKRELFYRRLGALKIDLLDYIFPLENGETPPLMEILIYAPNLGQITKTTLHTWLEKLYVNVYQCPKNDPRITQMLAPLPETLTLI